MVARFVKKFIGETWYWHEEETWQALRVNPLLGRAWTCRGKAGHTGIETRTGKGTSSFVPRRVRHQSSFSR